MAWQAAILFGKTDQSAVKAGAFDRTNRGRADTLWPQTEDVLNY